ncbi:ubiquinone-binding COQ10-like protein [Aspergillus candidus]|uniref:Dehydrase and lipid transport-domain-containing protein n=1 Tax=Aspergillus candidus TaxID=41067 RepID=A0A2I2FEQ8_ASPCN|nr:dehydrase and lipid transport-domain-containing protein [Aspergillus candidus]PLB39124.1 dehydrase and lipid transport-domain-containing protein [Aspergillus candidus]
MKVPFRPRQLSRATQRLLRPHNPPFISLPRTSSLSPTSTPHLNQQTTRPFNLSSLASLLPNNNNSSNNGGNNNSDRHRTLTAIRILPYAPTPLFTVISSVESYSEFLPFLTASTVTARDPATGLPSRAFLTVGYGPLSETFTSQVDCDRANWTVEARSGARFGVDSKDGQSQNSLSSVFPGANEGIFEYLSTRWELLPLEETGPGGRPQTRVQLEIRFEFRNQFHAAVMGAVEGQMAGAMIAAFEGRIRQLEGEA